MVGCLGVLRGGVTDYGLLFAFMFSIKLRFQRYFVIIL